MQKQRARGDGDDAYAELARHYPSLVLIVDAGFTLCSAAAHAWRRRRTRRLLETFAPERLDDIGFSQADLRNGRLDGVLRTQHAEAQPDGPWARTWAWLLKIERSRMALAAVDEDQLHALSEQGLKARREAQHHHDGGCTCRTSGVRP